MPCVGLSDRQRESIVGHLEHKKTFVCKKFKYVTSRAGKVSGSHLWASGEASGETIRKKLRAWVQFNIAGESYGFQSYLDRIK